MFEGTFEFIKSLYDDSDSIQLHEPIFIGKERKYLEECIESTFVSTMGPFVDRFEQLIAAYTGAKHVIACSTGTAALHAALLSCDVKRDDEVITQPLTFVATCNAISHCGAYPVFVDVDEHTLGLSPEKLVRFLKRETTITNGTRSNKKTGRRVSAVLPVHTYGLPCEIERIAEICREYDVVLIEDAAESLGSWYNGASTGTFGNAGILSFNGNKIITTGGGGAVLTNDDRIAQKVRKLSTTARVERGFESFHDEVAYNYRLPNLNAALGCAQLETLESILSKKRQLAEKYKIFFENTNINFVSEPHNAKSNNWLNVITLKDKGERDLFLNESQKARVMCRAAWTLMNQLPMYQTCQTYNLETATKLGQTLVSLPSGINGCTIDE